jgi:methyltransferase family protein
MSASAGYTNRISDASEVSSVAFKDHFSTQAREYTQFRPRYPRELFAFLSSLPQRREAAWDCGTGNGQAAVDLAEWFDDVIATDPSANQVAHAEPRANVKYLVATAEECPLASGSIDLVTVAQALHWFGLDGFYAQARRVGRAGSVLAAWSYPLANISPPVDRIVAYLYGDLLGSYWPPERKLIEERYQTIAFGFDEIPAPEFAMTAQWNLRDLIGYLGTWSSVQKYGQRHGGDPLAQVAADLAEAWGAAETLRLVRWPLYLRVGRIG